MTVNNPADQPDKSGLTPNQRVMIDNGITIGANMVGVALALSGVPGAGPILGGVGILMFQSVAPGKSPEAAYYEALSEQITAMETAVLSEIDRVSEQVKSLETDISQLYQNLSLQIDLNVFNECRDTIDQYYNDYASLMMALSTKKDLHSYGKSLWDLLSNHADDVAIKLQILHDTLLDGGDGTPGLISQQQALLMSSVSDWVANGSNYGDHVISTPRQGDVSFRNCRDIFYKGYGTSASNAFTAYVQPFLSSIFTLQYRGLTFLTAAWGGSIYTDQIAKHVDNARSIATSIDKLLSNIVNNDVIDQTIRAALSRTGLHRVNFSVSPQPESFTDLTQWVTWTNWNGPFYGQMGDEYTNGPIMKFVNIPESFEFGQNYDSWTGTSTAHRNPYYGFLHGEESQVSIPRPSSQVQKPLTAQMGTTQGTLKQSLLQISGPSIVMSRLPPVSQCTPSSSIKGVVNGISDPTVNKIQVFEYVGPHWKQLCIDGAISAGGEFELTVGDYKALYWTVMVTEPGWVPASNPPNDAPDTITKVSSYLTLPAA